MFSGHLPQKDTDRKTTKTRGRGGGAVNIFFVDTWFVKNYITIKSL